MKSFKRLLAALSLLSAFISGCENPVIEETVSLRLNKELISALEAGQTQRLEVTVTPSDADVVLAWASDNEAVAVVDDSGNVTGMAPGEAVVSVSADEALAQCKVVVVASKPDGIRLDTESLDMQIGQTHLLEVTLTPEGAMSSDMVWNSSNRAVAIVEDGLVTALAAGQTSVTVKCNDGKLAAVCHVTVSEPRPDKVFVTSITMPSVLELKVGASSVLVPSVLPENADDRSVTFTVDGDCVSVDARSGEVLALKTGVAKVTASANDGSGVKAECNVTVTRKETAVESVAIFAVDNAMDVQVGKTVQLYVECIPAGAVPNSLSWTIDNSSLATIDQNGLVTGVEALKTDGQWAKVVVSVNADGNTASLAIRVIPRQPESIKVDVPENNTLRVGEQWDFNPVVLPEGLGYGVTCSIMKPGNKFTSDPTVASDLPGTMAAQFAVASHENLVYSVYRRDVSLNVIPYWVETVSLPESQEMESGSSLVLTPVFTSDVPGVQPTFKDVKWSSSDPSVASINERTGEITANAGGETIITVTTSHEWSVPGGSDQKSAVCRLTVTETGPSLNVGDYYYSDGTWSSDLDAGKEVIGVVFAKSNATTSDALLARDYPDCTHGLVVSLAEYGQQDFGAVSCYNGHGYYAGLGYDAASVVDVERPNGYGNTLAHAALNASRSDYCSLFNAQTGVVAMHSAAVATPSDASKWYVPSYKEMELINASRDVVNAAINAAGGDAIAEPYAKEESFDDNRTSDWYWTSTIYGTWYGNTSSYDHYKYAFDISKDGWTTAQQPTAKCKVRIVLAF